MSILLLTRYLPRESAPQDRRDLAERHLPIYRFTYVTSVPRQQFSGLGVVGQPVHPRT